MTRHRLLVLGFVCALAACQQDRAVAPAPKADPTPVVVKAPAPAPAPVPAPTAAVEKKLESKGLLKTVAPAAPAANPVDMSNPLAGGLGAPLRSSMGGLGGVSVGEAQGLGGLGLKGTGTGGAGMGTLLGKGGGSAGLGMLGSAGGGYGTVSGHLGVSRGAVAMRGATLAGEATGTEDYGTARVNGWTLTAKDHLSTFAADVDTASYTLGRRKLMSGVMPPKESVRVEEWLNYFRWNLPQPPPGAPLAVSMDAAPSPFSPGKTLLRVGVQGRVVDLAHRKPAHLTFLVDVSGSMQGPDRLPLAQRSLRMLVDQLHDGDTVALVTYAGATRLVLPPTGLEHKALIHQAIADLTAGGSTGMGSGIELAYEQALKVLDGKSVSRVLVLSDGDANVGPTNHEAILKLIAGHVKEGVTVTTVGFGMGNYKSELMEQLADKGNGNHYYVDSMLAAKRIFVEQLGGTLEVIAQDVKLQVDFDPAQVNAYRLVGYENRDVADDDFRNDAVDAGEIGSGHRVTALYEVDLKEGAGDAFATVRVRAKPPRGVAATERAFPVTKASLAARFEEASADLRFATAVMGAAEILRGSPDAAEWSLAQVAAIAHAATVPGDAEREEFIALVEKAAALRGTVTAQK